MEGKEEQVLTAHVIDPDPVAVKMLVMLLGNMHLKVTTQGFEEDPFKKVGDLSPDFVVLDLPTENPPPFFETIYKDRKFARTKFVVCSAHTETTDSKAYLRRLKPDRAFKKPLDAAKFTREFKHLIKLKMKQKGWKSSYG